VISSSSMNGCLVDGIDCLRVVVIPSIRMEYVSGWSGEDWLDGLSVADSSSCLGSGLICLVGVEFGDSSCVRSALDGDEMEEESLDCDGEWVAVRFRGMMAAVGASSVVMRGICGGLRV